VLAPSSLAVDVAGESGLTLVAFLRGYAMNIYRDRIASPLRVPRVDHAANERNNS
jgi:FdhD protein